MKFHSRTDAVEEKNTGAIVGDRLPERKKYHNNRDPILLLFCFFFSVPQLTSSICLPCLDLLSVSQAQNLWRISIQSDVKVALIPIWLRSYCKKSDLDLIQDHMWRGYKSVLKRSDSMGFVLFSLCWKSDLCQIWVDLGHFTLQCKGGLRFDRTVERILGILKGPMTCYFMYSLI